jgi:hypothetical protein
MVLLYCYYSSWQSGFNSRVPIFGRKSHINTERYWITGCARQFR